MTINKDVVEAIGNTPLIKLKRASEETGCTILGKAEFMNPGQSVKDRAGKWMILEAEKRGDLKPGGLVVESTAGKIDGFICSVRTGGTLAGTSRALKEKNKGIVIACADPHGFAMYELFKHGQVKSTPGDSITEGIGLARVTPVIATAEVDDAFLISDEEAVTVIYELLEHEGLCLGGSTGINVAGAMHLAKQLGPGHTIVTILCDCLLYTSPSPRDRQK